MRLKKIFTEEQKSFIRENYLQMRDSKMVRILQISAYFIKQFRIQNRLLKKNPNAEKKVSAETKFFNVNQRDWIV